MKKKWICFFVGLVSISGATYSFFGVIMAMWLSATPNYSVESAKISLYKWVIFFLVFLFVFIYSLVYAYKLKGTSRSKQQMQK